LTLRKKNTRIHQTNTSGKVFLFAKNMETVNAGNLTKGMFIMFKGAPHVVTKTEFMSPGKGTPVMRVKLRNAQNGVVQEYTYKSQESVEIADVEKKEMNFIYKDGSEIVFMNPKTFEQETVNQDLIEDKVRFLVPNLRCQVYWHNGTPIGIELPPNVILNVIEAEDSVAGNRVNAPKKPVKVETGFTVDAPIFIKTGDKISVDTTTGIYLSRVN
jgi:elongation factor P